VLRERHNCRSALAGYTLDRVRPRAGVHAGRSSLSSARPWKETDPGRVRTFLATPPSRAWEADGIRRTALIRKPHMHLITSWLDLLGRVGSILNRDEQEDQLPHDPLTLCSGSCRIDR
jgi:hypothetical protein